MSVDLPDSKPVGAPPATLAAKTANATAWSLVSQVLGTAIQFTATFVFARLLTEADVGRAALAAVLVSFFVLLTDWGTASAVVCFDKMTREAESTLFWFILGNGVLFYGGLFVSAPWIADAYDEPTLVGLIRLGALVLIANAVLLVPLNTLTRDMRVRPIAVGEIIFDAFALSVSVFIAWKYRSPAALLIREIISTSLQAILLLARTRWRPLFVFDRELAKRAIRFGLGLKTTHLVNYGGRKIGDLVVAGFRGAAELGLYNRAFTIMLQPLTHVGNIAGRVFTPLFSKLKHDPVALEKAYLRALLGIAMVMCPFSAIFALCPEAIVSVLFGHKWLAMSPMVRWFAIAGSFAALETVSMQIFVAKDSTFRMARWRVLTTIGSVAAAFIGVPWGGEGVAFAFMVRALVFFPYGLFLTGQMLDLSVGKTLRALSPALLATLALVVTGLGMRMLLRSTGSILTLVGVCVAGGIAYVAALLLMRTPLLVEAFALLRARLRGAKS